VKVASPSVAPAVRPSVSVLPFDRTIECVDGETILQAVLRQRLYVRYGCRHGGCGTCKAMLVDGDVAEGGSSFALASNEREQGWILLCSSSPVTDCTIDIGVMDLTEEEFVAGDQVGTFMTVVERIEALTPDIRGVTLRLSDPGSMKFIAGQFVNVEIPGSEDVRSFSIASTPRDPGRIDLVVKLLPGGAFSSFLEAGLQVGDGLRMYGPFGRLKVRLSYRRILIVAGGSGLAPFLSMLAELSDRGDTRPVTVVFGARRVQDLYGIDQIERLTRAMPALEYVATLVDPDPGWTGETGFVTDVIVRRFPSLEGFDAYLAGPPPMIEAVIPLLRERGVRAPNIYFDAFVPTGG